MTHGPRCGYFPNALKTTVIAKPETYQRAVTIFEDTGISITDTGKRYLGGAVGANAFVEEFAKKIREWTQEVQCLSEIVRSQPHAAFAAFRFGIRHRWTYLTRVLPISAA